ncbi:hypothetical protein ACSLFT_05315 [Streptomyces sp. G6]|uniref:hypothetical protein n=1 Tax=unclassified Streptomyces TaxID=2593676 RepID=UPI0037AEC925
MAAITKIRAYIYTADIDTAGTDGLVYLGIAGREFLLATNGDDFKQGSKFSFVLGEDANVLKPDYNDPRKPALDTDDLDRYPVYIRLEPEGDGPAWCVERITVTVNPDSKVPHVFDNPRLVGTSGRGDRIWLWKEGGKQLFLKRYDG